MRHRSPIAFLVSWALVAWFGTAAAANQPPEPAPDPSSAGRVPTEALSDPAAGSRPLDARRLNRAAAAGETVYVYSTNLENLSSPSNEGGWTHKDLSLKPTAWHIDSLLSCAGMGKSWWCGLQDSSWIYDPNRAGYDNDWTQYLENSVNLDSLPLGTPVTLGFRHKFDAEPGYDFGYVEVLDLDQSWAPIATFTGKVPNGQGCDSFTVVIPDTIRAKFPLGIKVPFRFVFTSDVGYSSADGLYTGDGWVIDNITIKQGTNVRFFDNGSNNVGDWYVSTYPGVGDYYTIRNNVYTEDVCTANASKVWTAFDPVILTLVPRINNVVITPPIATGRANTVFMEFDVYRNLPLNGCFFYEPEYRTKNAGDADWSLWSNPTNFVYYGGNKDWAKQRITLPAAGNRDSVQYRLGLKDLSTVFCDGVSAYSNTYALFDNLSLGVIGVAPPTIVTRDIDLFNDTFRTTAFFVNDNFNTPLGDSAVVQVSASRGYKTGLMYYRLNGGSFASAPLTGSNPALPTFRYADVPAADYPANTTLEYYFAVTDSLDQTSYAPADAPTAQKYFSASILPLKTPINPALSCFDSLSTILFVNHFSGRETSPRIAEAMTSLGYKFDTWDVNGPTSGIGNCLGGSSPTDPMYRWPVTDVNSLIQYKTIVWHSGDLSALTITKEDQQVIQSWIQQSGKDRNFWIAGDDVAYELGALGVDYNSFLGFTCGARFTRDIWENVPQDTLHPIVSGIAGSPTAGRAMHLNGDCPIVNAFDLVQQSTTAPINGKSGVLLKYPNNQPAATRYATKYSPIGLDSARVIFQGFGFNVIEEGGERIQLVKNFLQGYFKENACYAATAVEDDPATQAPRIRTELFQNSPNPFNPETSIRYSVATKGLVTIDIYNVSGALVRTLVERAHDAGVYTVRWNGTDDAGRPVSSGVYFYQLRTPGFTGSKKLILLK
ncbi:MAG TPA: FlgD immunoglobulin-like domain containing protein [Candidatus Eisenbacteria bacterium]|nr:FlgD immunoglobulin-like domain containing protein [Candidatus Eisenbacteria bacterium]